MTSNLAIGIDLGGTQCRAALVDENGVVLRRLSVRTDAAGGPMAVIGQFKQIVQKICGDLDPKHLGGVGVAAPGPLDTISGTILRIPTLSGWEGFPLRDHLAAEFGVPVALENDGIAAAYGEWQFGAGQGLNHLVYVTVSTGIGGGVVIDGRLIHGRLGMAAHVGHCTLEPSGPICACGAVGCFEAVASGSALDRAARRAAKDYPGSRLSVLSNEHEVDAKLLVRAAREGDPIALGLLRREARYLGMGFKNLIHLFSPERIIMGGGVSLAFDLLETDINTVVQRDAMEPFKAVEIVPAALGDNAGLVGAAALALATNVTRASSGTVSEPISALQRARAHAT